MDVIKLLSGIGSLFSAIVFLSYLFYRELMQLDLFLFFILFSLIFGLTNMNKKDDLTWEDDENE